VEIEKKLDKQWVETGYGYGHEMGLNSSQERGSLTTRLTRDGFSSSISGGRATYLDVGRGTSTTISFMSPIKRHAVTLSYQHVYVTINIHNAYGNYGKNFC